MKQILETERLILREFVESDADALTIILGDPEIMKFSSSGALDSSGIKSFLAKTQNRYKQDGVGHWAVVLKESNELIGAIGLIVHLIEGQKYLEVGYRLARKNWHQGLASEAASACRDYAFIQLKKDYVVSIIQAENIPSIAVAERMGMKHERDAVYGTTPVRIYSIKKGSDQ